MTTENKYYSRGFLNTTEGMAAFECEMHYPNDADYWHCGATFSLTDCSRRVCIDLDFSDLEEFENAYNKATIMVHELICLKDKMAEI